MKARASQTEAFTRTELAVVLAVCAMLLCLLVPAFSRTRAKSSRIQCVDNLKEIGVAYRIWSNQNGDHYPANVSRTNGGWRELRALPGAGAWVWTNFAIVANDVSLNPSRLICPTDERRPANSLSNLANTNISYFAAPDANDTFPQSILGGDRNLGPGTTPKNDYGYSPANGKGNDVFITRPSCWSLKMHSEGSTSGTGNILLGDGSAQQDTSRNLNAIWFKSSLEATNLARGATNGVGIHLIFP